MTYGSVIEALGDPTRRAIFELVAEEPRAVVELASRVPVSRPAVSQHLKVLRDAGLVRVERDGSRRIYLVDPSGVVELRAYLDRFWEQALQNFKARAESLDKQQ
jgi:DNA-binding transcriptional ArsR family regulator